MKTLYTIAKTIKSNFKIFPFASPKDSIYRKKQTIANTIILNNKEHTMVQRAIGHYFTLFTIPWFAVKWLATLPRA